MPIEYLDGRRFRLAIGAGADWVRFTRDHINRINVFPVPDGDTGTNMALSLAATAAAVRAGDQRALGEVARQAAEASILNAKGNSGTIMAHWFLGLSKSFVDEPRAAAGQVSAALQHATDEVYAGIDRPVEGTVVSVMRAVSECAAECASLKDLSELMEAMLEASKRALQRTPEQLAVLREANVVDAGAQGYVNFLEGATRAIRGEKPPVVDESDLDALVDHTGIDHDPASLEERFCTEVVVRGSGFGGERLRRAFRPHGSSLMVATTGTVFKLHIHTNHPDAVLKLAARQGVVEERKVDDMLVQARERGREREATLIAPAAQPATVAVICDSTADLDPQVRARYGIEIASLQVLFGDKVFRDQKDLSTEEFYARLASDPHHPTTSQPPPREFVQALEKIRGDREVIVVTLSSSLSGTYKSAKSALALVPHPRVEVFDSNSASTGLGMMALNAARLAESGAGCDDILRWLARWREDTGLVFSLETLEFLRRGGRIGAAQSLIGSLLGLRPLLTFQDGRVQPLAKARGREDAYAKAVAALGARLPEGVRVRLGIIVIGDDQGQSQRVEAWLRERLDVVECVRGAPTGVVGAHAGPGAWGVFYQRVREDDPLVVA
jgi:DegV family protein with EDD domain